MNGTHEKDLKSEYYEYSKRECAGLEIVDCRAFSGDECIWVGPALGMEGSILTSDQVRELAAMLIRVADEHDAREE
jgi:hypothetical protein